MSSLDGLIDKDAITDLQKSMSTMSLSQRQQIAVNKDDIYFSFPYQVKNCIISHFKISRLV